MRRHFTRDTVFIDAIASGLPEVVSGSLMAHHRLGCAVRSEWGKAGRGRLGCLLNATKGANILKRVKTGNFKQNIEFNGKIGQIKIVWMVGGAAVRQFWGFGFVFLQQAHYIRA